MKSLFLGLIWLYQRSLSHIFQLLGVECRFYPSCSEYAREAFEKHGFIRGFRLSVKRVGKCHPWGGSGVDEVPKP
ncbi:MAG TPA: membrane protein insertion efficiency factor YidD [Candidatus Paceibacterota bacterium]|nr:membrane protein insertion efficiency factor YidD [Candidatus Paceibacterota bacterium]